MHHRPAPVEEARQDEDQKLRQVDEELAVFGVDPRLARQLFVDQLLPSVDGECLAAVFERDSVEAVQVLPDRLRTDGSKLAVVTYLDEDQVDAAIRELNGFLIDDGDVSRPMRLQRFADFERTRREACGGQQMEMVAFIASFNPA